MSFHRYKAVLRRRMYYKLLRTEQEQPERVYRPEALVAQWDGCVLQLRVLRMHVLNATHGHARTLAHTIRLKARWMRGVGRLLSLSAFLRSIKRDELVNKGVEGEERGDSLPGEE